MITKHLRGTTAELNALNLPGGFVAYDEERNAVRFYDGVVQGGFEVVGQKPPLVLPGPQELLHGDAQQGFYGEASASELITGDSLASLIGLSAGTVFNSDAGWLKFASEGSTLYVAKRPLRYSISWDQIHARGAVYGTVITIGGLQYRVRLLTGAHADPYTSENGDGSEWNRLLYPVHVEDPDQLGWGVGYSNADLVVGSGNGRATWVQETLASNTNNRVYRGLSSLSAFNTRPSSTAGTYTGWRPVLEFQPPEG